MKINRQTNRLIKKKLKKTQCPLACLRIKMVIVDVANCSGTTEMKKTEERFFGVRYE